MSKMGLTMTIGATALVGWMLYKYFKDDNPNYNNIDDNFYRSEYRPPYENYIDYYYDNNTLPKLKKK